MPSSSNKSLACIPTLSGHCLYASVTTESSEKPLFGWETPGQWPRKAGDHYIHDFNVGNLGGGGNIMAIEIRWLLYKGDHSDRFESIIFWRHCKICNITYNIQTHGFHFLAADIVFIVKDKQHPRFRRQDINLIHTAKVHLGKALTGCVVEINTLDDRILHIPINDIVK